MNIKDVDFQTQLNIFFKELRKEGYFAKQNFECCQSCALELVPKNKEKKYVFYHMQDMELLINSKSVYISFGGTGKEVAKLAKKNNLRVTWNGTIDERILLSL